MPSPVLLGRWSDVKPNLSVVSYKCHRPADVARCGEWWTANCWIGLLTSYLGCACASHVHMIWGLLIKLRSGQVMMVGQGR